MTRRGSKDTLPRLGFPLAFARDQTEQVDDVRKLSSVAAEKRENEKNNNNKYTEEIANTSSNATWGRRRSHTTPVAIKIWSENSVMPSKVVNIGNRGRRKSLGDLIQPNRSSSLSPRNLIRKHPVFPTVKEAFAVDKNGVNHLVPDASLDKVMHSEYYELPKQRNSQFGSRRQSVCTTDHMRLLQTITEPNKTELKQARSHEDGLNARLLALPPPGPQPPPLLGDEVIFDSQTNSSCSLHPDCGLVTTFADEGVDGWELRRRRRRLNRLSANSRQERHLASSRSFDTVGIRYVHKLYMWESSLRILEISQSPFSTC